MIVANHKLPSASEVQDRQFVEIPGPDGILSGFQYDKETQTFYAKESQVIIPSFHGSTHITSDPIPCSTTDNPGLMCADDKAKLDTLVQTKIGVLGFTGAGFSDDNGFLQGEIILAAGTEFISLERIGNVIRFTCFTGDCPVLMADGSQKKIFDVNIGDEVVTHTGKIHKVSKLYRHTIDDYIYNIKIQGHKEGLFKVTGEHPVLASKKQAETKKCRKHGVKSCRRCIHRYTKPDWIRIKELRAGDFVARKFSSDIVNDIEYINISSITKDIEVINERAYSVYYREKIKNQNGVYEVKNNKVITSASPIIDAIKVDNQFMRLCGYYLAEGSCGNAHQNDKKTSITFTISTEEAFGKMGQDIKDCVRSTFGIEPKLYKNNTRGTCYAITLYSSIAARFTKKLLPGTARTKIIPRWIMELPPTKQKELLVGFLAGDGYIRKSKKNNQISFGIAGKQLANQICAIFERIGACPVIRERLVYNKNTKKYHDRYTVTIQISQAQWLAERLGYPNIKVKKLDFSLNHSGYTLKQIKKIEKKPYQGHVYNIEVENDHSYIVNGLIVHNCDSPLPLSCNIEECANIFWIQDTTDTSSIRPPSCAGRLPGANIYGEIKVYLMPESTIVDPANPDKTLNTKGSYPAFIFKRYDDAITPGTAELEAILARNSNGTTQIGWAMTPGAKGTPESVWFMGLDDEGNQIRFDLDIDTEPNMFGQILYKGHSITKRSAVIVDYTSDIVNTNQYLVRYWNINEEEPIGSSFTATNVWRYNNPLSTTTDPLAPKSLVFDATIEILPVGSIVSIWEFQIGEVNGVRLTRRFFIKEPKISAGTLWSLSNAILFGNTLTARTEENIVATDGPTSLSAHETGIDDLRLIERYQWGITGFDDALLLSDDGQSTDGTSGSEILRTDSVFGIADVMSLDNDPVPNFIRSRHGEYPSISIYRVIGR